MTIFLHYDQAERDRPYDQQAWAPNAAQVIRRYGKGTPARRRRYFRQ